MSFCCASEKSLSTGRIFFPSASTASIESIETYGPRRPRNSQRSVLRRTGSGNVALNPPASLTIVARSETKETSSG